MKKSQTEYIIYAAFCALTMLFCLGGIIYTFWSGLYRDLDGIMLLISCLSIGGVFKLFLLYVAKEAGWIKLPKRFASASGEGK